MSLTLTTFLRISGDSSGARAQVRLASDELRKMGSTTLEAAKASREAAAALNRHARELIEADAAARAAAGGFAAQKQAVRDTAQANAVAAGSVGNLAAQFNDIGMMLAAGQNPLMLALQQGTQITQVFGNAGAATAVGMLKSAFLSLLSPLNLITLGVIGFGAAAIQWMMGAGEEALTLEDAVGALSDRVDAYKDAAERANASTADLRREFGEGAEAARAYARELAELEKREAERAAREAGAALRETFGLDTLIDSERKNAADFFGLFLGKRDQYDIANELVAALDDVDRAKGIENQVAAVERLRAATEAAAQADGQYTAAEDAALRQINALLEQQRALLGAIAQDQATAAANNGRFATADQIIAYQAAQAEARAEDQAWAAETLASLNAEAQIRALVLQYGNDSVVVAAARAAAERDAFAAMVESLNVSDALKQEMIRAFEAARGIASTNMAATIAAAVGQANQLAVSLRSAANYATLLGNTGQSSGPDAVRTKIWGGGAFAAPVTGAGLAWEAPRGSGGGGGGGAAGAEADAVADLIERLERERDLLRETDPVKKEMLRYREQLATATEEERLKVEELIATRLREDQQIKARSDLLEYANDMTLQFLNTVIAQGKSARSVLSSLVNELLRAFVTGKGVFAQMFGLQGGIWNALVPARAAGGPVALAEGGPAGMVRGPGTARSDSILARLSNGEFVVNAKATARNRALLEAVNAGFTPRFADGGAVTRGGGWRRAQDRVTDQRPVFNIHVHGATGNAEVRSMVRDGVAAGLRVYDSDALPRAVLSVIEDPKVMRR